MKTRLALLTLLTATLSVAATEADFGLVGITQFENARLTAYCDDSPDATPCAITFEFHDIRGGTLKQATVTLQPGTAGFLDFAARPGETAAGPVLIDPCWTVLRGAALASFEVFDMFSQRTRILINWGDRSLPRTGDVDFGLAGVTAFDAARLGAVCEGDGSVAPAPCDVTAEFHDMQGKTIKQSRMILQPGTGGYVDLKWQETGSTAMRVEIAPCWKVAGGGAVASFALVDSFTGLTIVQSYPAVLTR